MVVGAKVSAKWAHRGPWTGGERPVDVGAKHVDCRCLSSMSGRAVTDACVPGSMPQVQAPEVEFSAPCEHELTLCAERGVVVRSS